MPLTFTNNNKHQIQLILFILIGLAFGIRAASNDVIVTRSRMFVNDLEFIVSGMNYYPKPLGQQYMDPESFTGGTGLCSQQLTPFKQWKSNCYDGDYFDGTPWSLNASVNGFQEVWLRDFPLMVAAGVNTIRIFNCNPNTTEATIVFTNLFTNPSGRDHTLFMETAASFGLKVIFPLYFDDNDFYYLAETLYYRYLRWQIDEVGNCSSLLMWQFGDEQSWTWVPADMNNASIVAKYNNYADYIKRYTYSRWNRIIPITMSMQWDQEWFGLLIAALHIDVFSANIYTTSSYSLLFDGDESFEGFTTATCKYNKPFLITGFGPTYLPSVAYSRNSINEIWLQVIKNIDNGLIGAVYTQFTDDPIIYHYFGLVNVSIAYSKTGSGSSTRVGSLIPDAVARKQQYSDIQTGKYNGVAYNFKSNPYALLHRNQDTLSSTEDRCTPLGVFYDCPTSNPYLVCSGNGMCNRMNGTCTCGTGWTGLNCSIPVCPGTPECSLNGVCSPYVSPPQCVCTPGFYGPACNLIFGAGTCPSLCNGNGICGPRGGCTCFQGYFGADCSILNVRPYQSSTTFGALTTSASSAATTSSATSKSSVSSTSSIIHASTVASTSTSSASKASSTSTKSVSTSTSTIGETTSASTSATSLEATSTGAVSSSTSTVDTSTSSVSSEALATTSSTSTASTSSQSSLSTSTSHASATTASVSTSATASIASTSASKASTTSYASTTASKLTSTTSVHVASSSTAETSTSTTAHASTSAKSLSSLTTGLQTSSKAALLSSSSTSSDSAASALLSSSTSTAASTTDQEHKMNSATRNSRVITAALVTASIILFTL